MYVQEYLFPRLLDFSLMWDRFLFNENVETPNVKFRKSARAREQRALEKSSVYTRLKEEVKKGKIFH